MSAYKPLFQQVGDALFRRVVLERYSLVINAIGAKNHRFLDVGCGSGRYGIELARRGAPKCVGVDVSREMIDLATTESARQGVTDRCVWHVDDWLSFRVDDRFDAIAAMGYFDYVESPRPHLEKMIDAAPTGRIFASFPKKYEIRVPVRKARFALERGYVRFYTREEILSLFSSIVGLEYVSLIDLGRDYVAIHDAGAAREM